MLCCQSFTLASVNRESDVQKLNDSKDHLAAFTSKYQKMLLELQSYEHMVRDLEQHAR